VVVGWAGRREARERVAMAAALARSREQSATRQQQSERQRARTTGGGVSSVWRTHVRACIRACMRTCVRAEKVSWRWRAKGQQPVLSIVGVIPFGVYTERLWLHNTSIGLSSAADNCLSTFFQLSRAPSPASAYFVQQ